MVTVLPGKVTSTGAAAAASSTTAPAIPVTPASSACALGATCDATSGVVPAARVVLGVVFIGGGL